jgi:hypothetical protein
MGRRTTEGDSGQGTVLQTVVRPALGGGSPKLAVYGTPGLSFLRCFSYGIVAMWRSHFTHFWQRRRPSMSWRWWRDSIDLQWWWGRHPVMLQLQGRLRQWCKRGFLLQALIRRRRPWFGESMARAQAALVTRVWVKFAWDRALFIGVLIPNHRRKKS